MEPKPGIQPTTRQLGTLVEIMKRDGVKLILASAYYDPRHARFLAGETGPVRDAVLLNAAAALVAVDACGGALIDVSLSDQPLAEQLRAAIGRAASVVDSGAAARALDGWVSNSQELAAG